jgi:hypothetical protein
VFADHHGRQAEGIGGPRKAAGIHDSDEDLHAAKAIHY